MVLPKPWQRGQAPEGAVEAEQRGLGLDELDAAVLAGELLAEAQRGARLGALLEDHLAGFAVADLDGVDQALVQVGRDGEAVDQDEDGLREVDVEQRFGRGEFEDARRSGRGG